MDLNRLLTDEIVSLICVDRHQGTINKILLTEELFSIIKEVVKNEKNYRALGKVMYTLNNSLNFQYLLDNPKEDQDIVQYIFNSQHTVGNENSFSRKQWGTPLVSVKNYKIIFILDSNSKNIGANIQIYQNEGSDYFFTQLYFSVFNDNEKNGLEYVLKEIGQNLWEEVIGGS